MRFSEWLLDLFFTPRCIFCRRLLRVGQRPKICPLCHTRYPKHFLSDLQQVDDEDKVNGRCLFIYETIVRAALHRFKYEGQKTYAEDLAHLMVSAQGGWLKELKPDALLYVPLHWKRYQKRGYNQAKALAEALGTLCGVPVLKAVRRTVNTKPQMALGRTLRLSNMKGSMQPTKQYEKFLETHPGPLKMVIVDDIYTTGSTIAVISEALSRARVTFYFWAVARSHPDPEPENTKKGGTFKWTP